MEIKKLFSNPACNLSRDTTRSRRRAFLLICMICGALLFAIALPAASALAQEGAKATPKTQSGQNLGEVGAKLANPLASLCALSTSFNMPQFIDGNVNTGDPEVSATILFQPVMPIPLYGTGDDEWRLITRPIIPFIFGKPILQDEKGPAIHTPGSIYIFRGSIPEIDEFDHESGMGDIQLPVLLSLPIDMQANLSSVRDRSDSYLPPRTMPWVRTRGRLARPPSLAIRPSS